MKVRNKKTGEVFDALVRERGGGGSYSLIVCDIKAYEHSKSTLDETHFVLDEYDTLAELNKEWEDYEEPKEYWTISGAGYLWTTEHMSQDTISDLRQIGNYFETRDEAEKAVEKLKAWKRLKDKGFGFINFPYKKICKYDARTGVGNLEYQVKYYERLEEDLDLLFGGEE